MVFATNSSYRRLQGHGVGFPYSSRRRGYGRRIRFSGFFFGGPELRRFAGQLMRCENS